MKQCNAGTAVVTVDECKKACGFLGISRMGSFKEGRPCYKGGTGVCNQNVRKPGSGASRICKGTQIQLQLFTLGSLKWFYMYVNVKSRNLHISLMQEMRHQEEMLAICRQKLIITRYLCPERFYSPEVRTLCMFNYNYHHVRFDWVSS